MRKIVLFAALCALALLNSCSKSPSEKALAELDRTISMRDEYVRDFEARNDSLRAELTTAPDSLRWGIALELYQSYHHYSVDSAGHYVARLRRYARTAREVFRTRLTEIQLLVWAHDEDRALNLYHSIDTSSIKDLNLKRAYLAIGVEVFTNISRFPRIFKEDCNYADSLEHCRIKYIALDTLSYTGRKVLAQYLRDKGDLNEALSVFQDCFQQASPDYHELTSIAYNMALLYGMLGDNEQKKIWLSRSAIYDCKAPNRDFLSLYELALTLYDEGELSRANKYIKIHFNDVYEGDFQAKAIRSSRAQNIIVDASMKAERRLRTLLVAATSFVVLLLVVVGFMLMFTRRQAEKLAVANNALANANKKLGRSNAALAESNKIKDNYVFRYMDLSIRYLDKVEEKRHEYRQIAKNKGVESLLKALRSPAAFSDYKEFYAIFDRTFLGIFPDFVESVNSLLREEARFDVKSSKESLPTELRILATLKLGIEDSPRIASFLKCSLSTVYTYRAKMRNQAIGPKELFESRVKNIS